MTLTHESTGFTWSGVSRASLFSSWAPWSRTLLTRESDMFSLNHLPLDTDGDDGGAWYLHKTTDYPQWGYINNSLFQGQFIPANRTSSLNPGYIDGLTVASSSDLQLDASGTKGIANTAPTNPAFDGATFLGETVQNIPHIIGSSLFKARAKSLRAKQRAGGDEYLNVVFGWLPFLNDVQTFARAVIKSDEILNAYHEGSGSKIKRRCVLTDSSVYEQYSGNFSTSPSMNGIGSLTGTEIRSSTTKMWFAGCFRYYLPIGDDVLQQFRRYRSDAQKLFGVNITPNTIWNLAPWSWAADWQGNVGDVMKNISALSTDGLVLQYGYSMATHEKTRSMAARTAVGTPSPGVYAGRVITEAYKQRKPATPYGFGVDLNSLSAKQIAILTALGLSHGK